MSIDGGGEKPRAPAVFTIPIHRSFADSLATGLIARFGRDPLELASGRVLLPNNRAVRTLTEAFVRASGSGLLLPRLIPIGDPELEERIGGALDPIDAGEPVPPAVDPLSRLIALAGMIRSDGESSAEALRLARDLGRTLDALLVEEVVPARLTDAADDAEELARHWQVSLQRLQAIVQQWPAELAKSGALDLAERRNRLLRALAARWGDSPPEGFTVAAGITTTAPAVCALLRRIAFMPGGMVILPGLALDRQMPEVEWEALGPGEDGQRDETHPQYHLKLLLDRLGISRAEVQPWRTSGRAASPAARSYAVGRAMTSAEFTDQWQQLRPAQRRLAGIRTAEFPDPASEAQAIALALREAVETPGRTAALVTPDRMLAARVTALLERWQIAADDSAGKPLSQLPAGTLLLALVSAAAEDFAPVALLSLLKHPLVGGEGEDRRRWLDGVRLLDLALRGPRPGGGLAALDRHFAGRESEIGLRGCTAAWNRARPLLEPLTDIFAGRPGIPAFAAALTRAASTLSGDRAWLGPDGRLAAEMLAALEAAPDPASLRVEPGDATALLRQLLDERRVRPPFGGHPRVFIWGLLEARLQQADLMILGGLNEGVWPALPAPDPWLAPKIRSNLGLPGLEFRIGLSAHDFASALGAPAVLITRARRDNKSPTIASRFWLRLQAMTGGLPRDVRLERITAALDNPGLATPAPRPAPSPPAELRPKKISVTAVDRLNADPFAFYAQQILKLRNLEPIDAEHSAAWRGSAVHEVLQRWLEEDDCDPGLLLPRAEALLAGQDIHPMLRALWQPRLTEAIRWIAKIEAENRAEGRHPIRAEAKGEARIAGVTVHGRADRLDRLADGRIAIIDYKTGSPPKPKAVDAGFALQLGLLGLIAEAGGFPDLEGSPGSHEYWSLTKHNGEFGRCVRADKDFSVSDFLAHAAAHFTQAADRWLTGNAPFTAKLHPAFAPYGDYDQLMRLEEWYGRE